MSTLQLLSAEQAWHYKVIPLESNDEDLTVLSNEDDHNVAIQEELTFITGRNVTLQPVDEATIKLLLSKHYRKSGHSKASVANFNDDLLSKMITEAKGIDASDIHIEKYEETCRVRFRIDGKLIEKYEIPVSDYPSFINRIKIQSSLDIAEKRLPQDGRIFFNQNGIKIDIRVSILPTLYGEKAVLRLLGSDATDIDLESLGFKQKEFAYYMDGVCQPNGIVLISGPTGSGKTTTLYGTLKVLNKTDTNISTIEDPIEYTLEGINQVQVQNNIGLTFAQALRSFLRQDPDVIMLGEIRDGETANMAIRAALTGHLVLSTIHTNSAWESIARLEDMGVPSYLVATTLRTSVAQRLLRKLCSHCKETVPFETEMLPAGFKSPEKIEEVFVPVGCEHCYQTGYMGRKAIYEVIPITHEVSDAIRESRSNIDPMLEKLQVRTLAQNAYESLIQGETSAEEVYPLLLNA